MAVDTRVGLRAVVALGLFASLAVPGVASAQVAPPAAGAGVGVGAAGVVGAGAFGCAVQRVGGVGGLQPGLVQPRVPLGAPVAEFQFVPRTEQEFVPVPGRQFVPRVEQEFVPETRVQPSIGAQPAPVTPGQPIQERQFVPRTEQVFAPQFGRQFVPVLDIEWVPVVQNQLVGGIPTGAFTTGGASLLVCGAIPQGMPFQVTCTPQQAALACSMQPLSGARAGLGAQIP